MRTVKGKKEEEEEERKGSLVVTKDEAEQKKISISNINLSLNMSCIAS